MTGKEIADRYVSRGGVPHGTGTRSAAIDDLIVVGSFLAWQEPGELCGGETASDAWAAFCRLLDLHPVDLRNAMMGKEPA